MIKILILVFLLMVIPSGETYFSNQIQPIQSTVKEKAFTVLKNNCNTCHTSKKRLTIFTLDNMDSLSARISEQVFLKQKMPQGKKNQLTQLEAEQLKTWLYSLKNQ